MEAPLNKLEFHQTSSIKHQTPNPSPCIFSLFTPSLSLLQTTQKRKHAGERALSIARASSHTKDQHRAFEPPGSKYPTIGVQASNILSNYPLLSSLTKLRMYAHYIQEPSYDLNKFKFLRSTLLAIALVNACGYRGCPASATTTTSIAFSAGLAVDHAAPASFAAFPSAFSLVTRMNTLPSLGQTFSSTTLHRARWRPLHKNHQPRSAMTRVI